MEPVQMSKEPKGFIDLQSIVGQYGITDLSLRKMAAITLQIKVSKAQRMWTVQSEQKIQ